MCSSFIFVETSQHKTTVFCVSAHRFIHNLYHMHETQSMEAGEVSVASARDLVDLNKLRSALDLCLEKLPGMLELGQVPQFLSQEYSFPYHRPSIISMSSASSSLMPESIGYVLLQVSAFDPCDPSQPFWWQPFCQLGCIWMNGLQDLSLFFLRVVRSKLV